MANQINAIQSQTAALCCVARNENRYLKEWVDYHLGIGFSRIYIYDVGDAGDERCDSLDLGENVYVVNSFRGRRKRGNVIVDAYKKCYAEIGGSVKWIMYLGVNEFFALEKHSCVSDFLLDFIKSKGAVQCIHFNCRSYGSGGAEKYEDRPVRERFTAPSGNESYDKRYRSIYRTKIRSMEFVGHYCARNLHFTYNSDGSHCGNWILPTTRTVTYEGGHVDWYVTKSREEYAESGNRSPLYGNGLGMNFYNEFNHCKGKATETPVGLGSAATANTPIPNAGIEDGVSICLSAWNTQDYIEECLDSIAAQTWFKTHDNWEILLGIDACEKTLAKVKQIMHKYKNLSVYMMNENVGTYITCNTIMKQAKYGWLLRFDTDDVMPNDMLEKIFTNNLTDFGIVRYKAVNFGANTNSCLAYGSHMIRRNIFNEYGGYRDWRIAADYDIIYRIEPNTKVKELRNVHYNRRVRSNGLQYSPETNMKSKIRLELHEFIQTKSRNEAHIHVATTTYTLIHKPSNLVSFIIPNRGGTHIQDVINNINITYSKYDREILIINQCDDGMFKKGQIYNIGLNECHGEWVALCDNDIIHFHEIKLFEEYKNNNNKPYLGFDHITQVSVVGENKFRKHSTKLNNVGAGAFLFGRKSDFIAVNGFSNLYMGWGCEDNEMSCRLCSDNSSKPQLKHLQQELGHITHPSRAQNDVFRRNQNIFFSRQSRQMEDDGLAQTTYNIIEKRYVNDVIYIDANNINVVENFKYKDLL